jgi:hypothetical protein
MSRFLQYSFQAVAVQDVDATTGFLLDSLCANKRKKFRENEMPGFKQEVREHGRDSREWKSP